MKNENDKKKRTLDQNLWDKKKVNLKEDKMIKEREKERKKERKIKKISLWGDKGKEANMSDTWNKIGFMTQ